MSEEEAAKIRHLKAWPLWPWLPVKKRGSHDIGVIFADDIDIPDDDEANGPIRVFNVNVFQCSMTAAAALASGVQCPWPIHKTYTDVEAMLDDGWLGD